MNSDVKVNLTITLKGSVIMSKEECLKTIQKEITKKNPKNGKAMYKKIIDIQVEDWDKCDKNVIKVSEKNNNNPETITFFTRKTKPAIQVIGISNKAYDYMISNVCPEWSTMSEWARMSKKAKLESHFNNIAEYLGGKVSSYQIFDE